MKSFGNLLDGFHGIRIGDITGAGHQQVLINAIVQGTPDSPVQWYLGDISGGQLGWNPVGQSSFTLAGGLASWISIGDYTSAGHQQVLYYWGGNGNWWFGDMAGGQLSWYQVSQSTENADLLHGLQRNIWIGDFTGAGHQQVLFYHYGDGNWFLGDMANAKLNWGDGKPVGNTARISNLLYDPIHASFWIGDFIGAGHQQVLLYYWALSGGTGSWWLGDMTNGTLNFGAKPVSDTSQYGDLLDGAHSTWNGDFTGAGHEQVLFYYNGDGNWFLGDMANGKFNWNNVGNSAQYGNLLDSNHAIWIGDFTGAGHQQVLFYYNCDGNWFLGDLANGKLNWYGVGNSAGFGNLNDGNHAAWNGDFTGAGHQQVLFYYNGDGNWFLGDMGNGKINWNWMGSTGT